MDEATAAYAAEMLRIQQAHASIQAPAGAVDFYATQHLVYGDHVAWARAQQIIYQSLASDSAVEMAQTADKKLRRDKRDADKERAKLVRYIGMSRNDLFAMMREAGAM